MSTVGYGSMHPATHATNLLASAEAMLGMTGFALGAALMFARVSRPSARVLFSRIAVIGPYEGRPAFMFRVANRRHNHILEAKMLVTLVRTEITAEGEHIRRFHELRLRHARTPIFTLPWTLIHPIDDESPLADETEEGMRTGEIEIVALLTGIDDVFSQPVHARRSYVASEIRWNARLLDVLERGPRGRLRVDFRRFHEVQAATNAGAEPSASAATSRRGRYDGGSAASRRMLI
jgi:inward rectifier potassium channel